MNSKEIRKGAAITLILRWLIGGIFLAAGALKLANLTAFAADVSHYRLLPRAWLELAAIIIPGIELVAGLLAIAGIWTRAAALTLAALTSMFLGAIASALARGLNIDCGCFGTLGGRRAGVGHLAFDCLILAGAAWLFVRADRQRAVRSASNLNSAPVTASRGGRQHNPKTDIGTGHGGIARTPAGGPAETVKPFPASAADDPLGAKESAQGIY